MLSSHSNKAISAAESITLIELNVEHHNTVTSNWFSYANVCLNIVDFFYWDWDLEKGTVIKVADKEKLRDFEDQ